MGKIQFRNEFVRFLFESIVEYDYPNVNLYNFLLTVEIADDYISSMDGEVIYNNELIAACYHIASAINSQDEDLKTFCSAFEASFKKASNLEKCVLKNNNYRIPRNNFISHWAWDDDVFQNYLKTPCKYLLDFVYDLCLKQTYNDDKLKSKEMKKSVMDKIGDYLILHPFEMDD